MLRQLRMELATLRKTLVQPLERHLELLRDELDQFISPCFVHSIRGKIIYCHITMQIEQQSQITTEKENVPPRILKEIPTNNISKSLSTMIRVQKLQ